MGDVVRCFLRVTVLEAVERQLEVHLTRAEIGSGATAQHLLDDVLGAVEISRNEELGDLLHGAAVLTGHFVEDVLHVM